MRNKRRIVPILRLCAVLTGKRVDLAGLVFHYVGHHISDGDDRPAAQECEPSSTNFTPRLLRDSPSRDNHAETHDCPTRVTRSGCVLLLRFCSKLR